MRIIDSFTLKKKDFTKGLKNWKLMDGVLQKKRFESYNIESFLSPEKIALDIGSNCGFFALFVSRYVKHIDGVEINPYMTDIGNDVKKYLNITNTTFHNSSFEEFTSTSDYDVIFSLANDSTIDKNTKFHFYEYLDKILSLLKKMEY